MASFERDKPERQLALKSPDTIGSWGLDFLSFRMSAPFRLYKGSLLSCHRLPGTRNSCLEGSLPLLLLKLLRLTLLLECLKTHLALCLQGHQRANWKSCRTSLFLPHVQTPWTWEGGIFYPRSVFVSFSTSRFDNPWSSASIKTPWGEPSCLMDLVTLSWGPLFSGAIYLYKP